MIFRQCQSLKQNKWIQESKQEKTWLLSVAWLLVVALHFWSVCFICPMHTVNSQFPCYMQLFFRAFITYLRKSVGLFYSAKELTVCYYYRSACTTETAKHSLEKKKQKVKLSLNIHVAKVSVMQVHISWVWTSDTQQIRWRRKLINEHNQHSWKVSGFETF